MIMKGLLVLVAAGVAGAAGRAFYRRPVWGVAALAFVAPLEKISVYWIITWKPFLPVFFILAAAVLLRHLNGRESRPPLTVIDRALLLLLLMQAATLFVAADPVRTLRMTVQFGILYAMAHLTIRYVRGTAEVRLVLFFLFLSGGLVVSYGMLQLVGGFAGIDTHLLLRFLPLNPTLPRMLNEPGAVYFPNFNRFIVRVSSTFFDWNFFGGYLISLLSLSIPFLVYRRRSGGRWPHLAVLTVLAAVLLGFTFSRSAWIGMVAAGVCLYCLVKDAIPPARRRMGMAAVFALAVLLNFTLGNPASFVYHRLANMFQGDPSVVKHGDYGRAALEMFYSSPLLGIGLHNFPVVYQQVFDPADAGATAHSTFLTYFAETGILGTLAHLFFHALALFLMGGAIRCAMRSPERFSLEYFVLAAVLAAYVGILTCNVFYFFNNQAFIWMFLGLGLAQARIVTRWDVAPGIEMKQRRAGMAMATGS